MKDNLSDKLFYGGDYRQRKNASFCNSTVIRMFVITFYYSRIRKTRIVKIWICSLKEEELQRETENKSQHRNERFLSFGTELQRLWRT